MKTTLDLPDDLVQALKLRSVHERRKLKDVAAAALRRGLQVSTPTTTPPTEALPEGLELNARGFPVFKAGRGTPASRMAAEELVALEQQVLEQEELKRVGLAP